MRRVRSAAGSSSGRVRGHLRWLGASTIILSFAAATLFPITSAAADEPFYLIPGDRVSITIFEQPDLSGTYLIEPSGTVELPLVGSINVTTSTSQDLQNQITSRLKDGFLQNPVVSVRLTELQPITIVGQIRGPGRFNFVAGMTVEAALALAGGVRPSSDEAAQRSELLRTRERLNALTLTELSQKARKARLSAQAKDLTDFDVTDVSAENADTLKRTIEGERRILSVEVRTLQNQVVSATERKRVFESDIQAYSEQTNFEREQIATLDHQLADVTGLLVNGLTRKSPVLDLQREKARAQGDLSRGLGDLARAKAGLADIDRAVQDLSNLYHSRVASDLQSVSLQLDETESTMPIVREELRAQTEQLPLALQGGQPPTIKISRVQKGQSVTIASDLDAVLRPGDIVQVGSVMASTGAADPVGLGRPAGESEKTGAVAPLAAAVDRGAIAPVVDKLSQR